MDTDDIDKAIEETCAELSTIAPDIAQGKGKAYEVWVLLATARRLREDGLSVVLVDPADNAVTTLVVRKNPGKMPSCNDGPSEPGHLIVLGAMDDFEIHLGLQHEGRSGATHEIDISVLPRSEGRACRDAGGGNYLGRVCLALELKAYSDMYKLDQGIPRALLGTMVDIDPTRSLGPVVVRMAGREYETSRDSVECSSAALVTSTKLYENSKRLLSWHRAAWLEEVTPDNDGELDRLVRLIRSHWHWPWP